MDNMETFNTVKAFIISGLDSNKILLVDKTIRGKSVTVIVYRSRESNADVQQRLKRVNEWFYPPGTVVLLGKHM